jgi:hypothetical protein
MAKYTQEQLANMSDEDLLNLDSSALAFNSEETTENDNVDNKDDTQVLDDSVNTDDKLDDDDQNNDDNQDGDTNGKAADDKDDEQNGDPDDSKGDTGTPDDAVDPKDTTKPDVNKGTKAAKDEPTSTKPVDPAPATTTDVDLKAFHSAITGEFTANGKKMQVHTAEEAVQLMQMGVGFHRKMEKLKPKLNIVSMLEKANLMDVAKISLMIDVMAKKPEAISKLVQDSGIDPLEISAEKAGGYTPGNHTVTDEEQALDEVFDDLQGSAGFDRTLNIIDKQWDTKSRSLIAQNPKALRDITAHVAAGVFDEVQAQVEREKTFGRLTGLSDLEAYRQVGVSMMESGKLAHLMGKATPSSQQAAPAKVVDESKPQKADDSKRREQRANAAPTRATTTTGKTKVTRNPLDMSDEELSKLDISAFS